MIDLRPLDAGAQINAFGYPMPKISTEYKDGKRVTKWMLDPSTSTGFVTEVFYEKRDTAMLKFPCYQTNAQFKHSMSGGPGVGCQK